jgi:hypothetical protein
MKMKFVTAACLAIFMPTIGSALARADCASDLQATWDSLLQQPLRLEWVTDFTLDGNMTVFSGEGDFRWPDQARYKQVISEGESVIERNYLVTPTSVSVGTDAATAALRQNANPSLWISQFLSTLAIAPSGYKNPSCGSPGSFSYSLPMEMDIGFRKLNVTFANVLNRASDKSWVLSSTALVEGARMNANVSISALTP